MIFIPGAILVQLSKMIQMICFHFDFVISVKTSKLTSFFSVGNSAFHRKTSTSVASSTPPNGPTGDGLGGASAVEELYIYFAFLDVKGDRALLRMVLRWFFDRPKLEVWKIR